MKLTGLELLNEFSVPRHTLGGIERYLKELEQEEGFDYFWHEITEIARIIGNQTRDINHFNEFLIGVLTGLRLIYKADHSVSMTSMANTLQRLYDSRPNDIRLPNIQLIAMDAYNGYSYVVKNIEDDSDFDSRILSSAGFSPVRATTFMFQQGMGVTISTVRRTERSNLKNFADSMDNIDFAHELDQLLENGGEEQ